MQPRLQRELSWVKVPTDPLIYRLYEFVSADGTTIKPFNNEEFGDGLMSAIDSSMDMTR